MSDPIDRDGLAHRFWETKPMDTLNTKEWEALCDGCGKCCLNKLEDEDAQVDLTRVSCKLLDTDTCFCSKYETRHKYVPECITMSPETIKQHMYWLPQTCGYRLVYEGKPLYDWHPLISGDPETVHQAGVTLRGYAVSEDSVHEDDWDDYIIKEPT